MTEELAGKTILIVEDDYLLATDLERILRDAGAKVSGPFSRSDAALAAIERGEADGAVLDINLGKGPTFDVANALDAHGVPFVFVTGYETVPDAWRHVPFVSKPVERREVVRVMNRLLS